jgi:hypothetical protein
MAFNDQTIQQVWEKGTIVPGYDPAKYRQDKCRAWMVRSEYGNRNSNFGWEVDHIIPNGIDYLSNLQPLQWENNVAKGVGALICAVTSRGNVNARVGS